MQKEHYRGIVSVKLFWEKATELQRTIHHACPNNHNRELPMLFNQIAWARRGIRANTKPEREHDTGGTPGAGINQFDIRKFYAILYSGGDIMKRIVVCDDNPESIAYIKALLQEYLSDNSKQAEILYYSSGEKMLEEDTILNRKYETDNVSLSERKKIDIAILDVEMANLSGIQSGYEIQKRYPDAAIMITTAYMRYLDDAMDLRVFRYFEKPVDKERLFKALDLLFRKKKTLSISARDETKILSEDEIVCITAKFRYSEVLTSMGESISCKMTLKEWINVFSDNNSFARPHSSYLVNLNYVRGFGNDYVIVESRNGKKLKIYASRRRFPEFKKAFNDKMEEYK